MSTPERTYSRWLAKVANQLLNRIERRQIHDAEQLVVALGVAAEQAVGAPWGGRRLVLSNHPDATVAQYEGLFIDDVTDVMESTARNHREWEGFDCEDDRTWPLVRSRNLRRTR